MSALRLALALVAVTSLAGCGTRGGGPAWPKTAVSAVDPDDPASDGGESLDPRDEAIASVEASAEPAAAPADARPAPDAAGAPPTSAPATDAPATDAPPTEPPVEGEIVIEVTGD